MRLASYLADGRAAFGVVTDDGVITMNERLGGRAASLKEALAAGLIPQIAQAAAKTEPDHELADITFLPAIPNPAMASPHKAIAQNTATPCRETRRTHPEKMEASKAPAAGAA